MKTPTLPLTLYSQQTCKSHSLFSLHNPAYDTARPRQYNTHVQYQDRHRQLAGEEHEGTCNYRQRPTELSSSVVPQLLVFRWAMVVGCLGSVLEVLIRIILVVVSCCGVVFVLFFVVL